MKSIEDWLARPGGLAVRLRELRTAAGLTGTQLSGVLGWTQSKISKLETGRQMSTEDDITAWAAYCQASPELTDSLLALLAEAQGLHQEWKQQVRLGQVAIQLAVVETFVGETMHHADEAAAYARAMDGLAAGRRGLVRRAGPRPDPASKGR